MQLTCKLPSQCFVSKERAINMRNESKQSKDKELLEDYYFEAKHFLTPAQDST